MLAVVDWICREALYVAEVGSYNYLVGFFSVELNTDSSYGLLARMRYLSLLSAFNTDGSRLIIPKETQCVETSHFTAVDDNNGSYCKLCGRTTSCRLQACDRLRFIIS